MHSIYNILLILMLSVVHDVLEVLCPGSVEVVKENALQGMLNLIY